MWLQERPAQGLACSRGCAAINSQQSQGTMNSPTDLTFHTLNPFGPCIRKPGQRELGGTVYRRHSQNTGLGIQRRRGWRAEEEYTESTEDLSDTGLITQRGEKLLISASSGNFVVPYRDLAVSGMNGLVAPDWERLDKMDGWGQAGSGERWTERQRCMETQRDQARGRENEREK